MRSNRGMKRSTVTVPWREGLHLRQAVRLVRLGRQFHSSIRLKCGGRIADLRSILSILALCATMGATLVVEVDGDDEREAARSVEQAFVDLGVTGRR
jgi:phosphotransferase system HPr (HPr) family protein